MKNKDRVLRQDSCTGGKPHFWGWVNEKWVMPIMNTNDYVEPQYSTVAREAKRAQVLEARQRQAR